MTDRFRERYRENIERMQEQRRLTQCGQCSKPAEHWLKPSPNAGPILFCAEHAPEEAKTHRFAEASNGALIPVVFWADNLSRDSEE